MSALDAAIAALKAARETEVQLREDHARALSLVEAELRILFPRDSRRRRRFFPRSRRSRPRRVNEAA